jgi:hypothetical protein
MESMMKLPDDMFRLELLPYLTVYDIVKLDSACINHKYRPHLLEKISGVILPGDKEDEYMKASLFKWLGIRQIYFIKMMITPFILKNNYVDQFRYTQHIVMRGMITDDMAIFIISHCPCLLSIIISNITGDFSSSSLPQITDHTLQSIAENGTRVESLSLRYCRAITDAGLVIISEHCTNLKSLNLRGCNQITDASIISISTHCMGLQSIYLWGCDQITDDSIISISTNCTGLQSLDLIGCKQITDTSIISISIHCTGLQSFTLWNCYLISDASIIPISENCTGLKEMFVSYIAITDASLIAIAKNCTRLQLLTTDGCNGLSSDKLRDEFKSVSELRAILLSIYPSLSI